MVVNYATKEELEAGMTTICQSPKAEGVLRLIVRRPAIDVREVLSEARLDIVEGLVGDTWRTRGSSRTSDGSSHPEMQINIMNVRVIALLAGSEERWPLAGDQLYVDLDLSQENVPPGTRLCVGTAVLAVTGQPHTGCKKFSERFGPEALRFVNTPVGRAMNLRGINAKVVQGGMIRAGDIVKKISM